MSGLFDRAIFDPDIFDVGDGPTPLADTPQARPLTAKQTRPLTTAQSSPLRTKRHYPLAGVKQTYPLGGD